MTTAQMPTIRARSTPLSVSPILAQGIYTNSPPSLSPSTRTITTNSVTATGGTGSYSWTRISGSTALSANSPSSATTSFTSTTVPVNNLQTATFRCTSGAETFDISVEVIYNSGL